MNFQYIPKGGEVSKETEKAMFAELRDLRRRVGVLQGCMIPLTGMMSVVAEMHVRSMIETPFKQDCARLIQQQIDQFDKFLDAIKKSGG